jgi:hypothetical protein
MKNIKSILTIILILTFVNIYANKDRIERPESFKFIFENNEVVNLSPTDSNLKIYCDEIVSQKRKLIEAQLSYKTGEIVILKYNGKNWTSIKISYKNKKVSVPKKVLKKITEINFSTLNLVWASDNEVAFKSSYFFIEFDLGKVKAFNKLPYLVISFEKIKFSNCVIWNQISEKSKQWSEF